MKIRTRQDVEAALALFVRDANGVATLADSFVRLSSELHMRSAKGEDVARLQAAVVGLSGEHSSLLTILERSEWQKRMAKSGQLDHMSWLFFATLDVEHFYVALRSLFDHLAGVCDAVATKKNQCPTSFSTLWLWCGEMPERAERLLGADLVSLVRACDWFESARDTRDGIVHFGALTLAFPSFETVSFKVYAGQRSSVVPDELMTNENIADFELFMAWTLGNLGLLMDRLGSLVLMRIAEREQLHTRVTRPGFATLCVYLDRLAVRLDTAEPAESGAPGA